MAKVLLLDLTAAGSGSSAFGCPVSWLLPFMNFWMIGVSHEKRKLGTTLGLSKLWTIRRNGWAFLDCFGICVCVGASGAQSYKEKLLRKTSATTRYK